MQRSRWTRIGGLVAVLVAALAGAASARDVTVQGQWSSANADDDRVALELHVRAGPDGGGPLVFAEHHASVAVDQGLFVLRLGDGVPLAGSLRDVVASEAPLFVRVWFDGRPLGAPEPLTGAPDADRLAVDPPSPELRVFDGQGRELGLYAGSRLVGGDPYFVHRSDLGLTVALRASTGEIGVPDLRIFYEWPGCGGQAYVERRWSGVVFAEAAGGYLVGTATGTLPPLSVGSSRVGSDGVCEDRPQEIEGVVPVTRLDRLPLDLPVTRPLHVGVVADRD